MYVSSYSFLLFFLIMGRVYIDMSSGDFPKTLKIRNTHDGMIWQVYHPDSQQDVDEITKRAHANGFYGITLENYQPEEKETWSDWRETKVW